MIVSNKNKSENVLESCAANDKKRNVKLTDHEIWQQFKQGMESAFIYIYDTYFNLLYNYSLQFTSDQNLIKDCIQDLFLDIRRNRNTLSDTTSIKLYLFKSIKRRIIRTEQRHRNLYAEDDMKGQGNFSFVLSHEHHLISKQLSQEKLENLQTAVNKLPDRQKEIIYYLFYQDMKYAEIRELMDLGDTKTARNLAYRAFKSLRSTLSRS